MANKEQFFYELKCEGLKQGSKSWTDYGKGREYVRKWKVRETHRVYEELLREYVGL